MSRRRRHTSAPRSDREARASELQQAAGRLEEAVQDVVRGARADFAGKTAGLLDEATARLRGEAAGRRRHRYSPEPRLGDTPTPSVGLYRAVANAKIGGVCAGFANYFGVEAWVARCVAVTGLLFLPTITFPAYWIAYFLLDDDPEELLGGGRRAARHRKRADRRAARRKHKSGRQDQRRASDEVASNFAPRRALRHINADLTAAELRLRRMEGHVTSDQYELRKQLHALDG